MGNEKLEEGVAFRVQGANASFPSGLIKALRDRRSDRRQQRSGALGNGHRPVALERIGPCRAWIRPARLFHLIPTAPE